MTHGSHPPRKRDKIGALLRAKKDTLTPIEVVCRRIVQRTYKSRRRKRGKCNDCKADAMPGRVRCEVCAERHRNRERFCQKHGRVSQEDIKPLWKVALEARGQVFGRKAS